MYIWPDICHKALQKKAVDFFKKGRFKRCNIDMCLYMKRNMKQTVHVTLYVNDNLIIGDSVAIDQAVEQLEENWLVLKVANSLQDICPAKSCFKKTRRKHG